MREAHHSLKGRDDNPDSWGMKGNANVKEMETILGCSEYFNAYELFVEGNDHKTRQYSDFQGIGANSRVTLG